MIRSCFVSILCLSKPYLVLCLIVLVFVTGCASAKIQGADLFEAQNRLQQIIVTAQLDAEDRDDASALQELYDVEDLLLEACELIQKEGSQRLLYGEKERSLFEEGVIVVRMFLSFDDCEATIDKIEKKLSRIISNAMLSLPPYPAFGLD